MSKVQAAPHLTSAQAEGLPGGGSAGIPTGLKGPGLLRELCQLVHHLLKARVWAALHHALSVLLPTRLPAIHLRALGRRQALLCHVEAHKLRPGPLALGEDRRSDCEKDMGSIALRLFELLLWHRRRHEFMGACRDMAGAP